MAKSPESAGSRSRWLGVALLVGFPIASVLLLLGQRNTTSEAPLPAEWRALANSVRPQLKDGDLIRIIPAWDSLGRTVFEDTVPGTSSWPFPALDSREPADPIAWMGFRRIVQVAWHDRAAADAKRFPTGTGRPEILASSEHLTARSFALPPSPLRWSSIDHLEKARVRRIREDGTVQPCSWNGSEHDCPGKKWWQDVQVARLDAGDLPRDCIFMEPHPARSRIELHFAKVPWGPKQTLLLRAGSTIQAARKAHGGTLEIELFIDGVSALRDQHHRNDYLLIPWALEKSHAATAGSHAVSVRVGTNAAGWRQECVQLYVLAPEWEQWGPVGYGHPYRGSPDYVPVRQMGIWEEIRTADRD